MHPQSTPQNTADTPTMLSENAHLAELRLFPFVSINGLQTPTKLVLNRAFQIAINKIARLRRPLRGCCLVGSSVCFADEAWRPGGHCRRQKLLTLTCSARCTLTEVRTKGMRSPRTENKTKSSGEDAKEDDVDEHTTTVSCRYKIIESLA